MKRYTAFILIFLCIFALLTGCATIVSEETETVQVTVTDCKYYPGSMVYIDENTYIWNADEYIVWIGYNGESYRFNNYELYRKYKDNIGCTVNATYKTVTYDNGKVKSKITDIE